MVGTPYLADGITGINLARGEEIVAFLVSRNTAFPYDERTNASPEYPCDLFRLNSLPIFGKTGDEGTGIKVDPDQLAVRLALKMGGCADWEEFQSKAVQGKGVPFAVRSRSQQSLQERQADARARTYGLFVISNDTFLRIKRKARFTGEKPVRSDASLRREQVGQVLAMYDAFFEMQRFMKGEPAAGQTAAERILADKRKRLTGLIAATLLEGTTEYQDEAGDMVQLPMLSRVFGDGHGVIFGRDFQALTRSLGLRGADAGMADGTLVPGNAAEVEDLTRYLELLWETQRFYFGMRYISAHVAPSMAGGQRPNRVDIIDMARQTIEAGFLAELAFLDDAESLTKQYKDIRLQLTRAKATLARLEEQYDQSLVKARAVAKASEPEPIVVRDVVEVIVEDKPVQEAEQAGKAATEKPKAKRAPRRRKQADVAAGETKASTKPEDASGVAVAAGTSPQAGTSEVQPDNKVVEPAVEKPAMDVDAVREKFGLGKIDVPF